jgi:hypothetical protein
LLLVLCASATLLFDKQAHAQCSARDVIRRHPNFAEQSSSSTTPKPTEPAAGIRVWKSIEVGTFATKTALYQALDDADCAIGNTAEEILVAQEFRLSGVAMKLNLVAISVNELGIARENATLKNIYARAQLSALHSPLQRPVRNFACNILNSRWASFLRSLWRQSEHVPAHTASSASLTAAQGYCCSGKM